MPHTHQYDTRYKDSRVGEIQRDTETYEAQPTRDMEVITINNIETQPEETPQEEPEIDMRVDNQPRRPEGIPQPGDMSIVEMIRTMMEETVNKSNESLKEDGRKSREENQKNIELLNRNMAVSYTHLDVYKRQN